MTSFQNIRVDALEQFGQNLLIVVFNVETATGVLHFKNVQQQVQEYFNEKFGSADSYF